MPSGEPMITKCGRGTFWILTAEDVDLDRMEECMSLTNDGTLDLIEELEAALSKGAD